MEAAVTPPCTFAVTGTAAVALLTVQLQCISVACPFTYLKVDEADIMWRQLALCQEAQVLSSLAGKGLMRTHSSSANHTQVPGRALSAHVSSNAAVQPASVDLIVDKLRALKHVCCVVDDGVDLTTHAHVTQCNHHGADSCLTRGCLGKQMAKLHTAVAECRHGCKEFSM